MPFVSRCFQGFLISTLSIPAYSAESVPASTREQTARPAAVDASSLVEVVQVLSLANLSQLDNIALVKARNPDAALQLLAADLERDHQWMQGTLEALARRKRLGLNPEDLTPTSLQVKKNVDVDYQSLAQKPQEEFRATFLRLTMKATISVFRPLIQKALADTTQLENEVIMAL